MCRKNVGTRLEKARFALGYVSVSDFLNATGLKKGTYYSIVSEGRKPNSNTLFILENAGINPIWLLDGVGEMLIGKKAQQPEREDYSSMGAVRISRLGELFMEYKKRKQGDENEKPIDDDDFWRVALKVLSEMDKDELRKMRNIINIILGEQDGEDH